MKPEEIEGRMRALEAMSGAQLLPGAWVVIRADGRSFSRLTAERFEKPFDRRFHDLMVDTARALMDELQGIYTYTESDEISVLLPRDWAMFERRWEKVVTLAAGVASATFSLGLGQAVSFDARAWVGATDEQVVDYFRWRQSDATRCALHGACYWTLRQQGLGPREASSQLEGMSASDKNELLFAQGINFNDLPPWQRRGVELVWERYQKQGFNPQTGQTTVVARRRVAVNEAMPMKEDYAAHLRALLSPNHGRTLQADPS